MQAEQTNTINVAAILDQAYTDDKKRSGTLGSLTAQDVLSCVATVEKVRELSENSNLPATQGLQIENQRFFHRGDEGVVEVTEISFKKMLGDWQSKARDSSARIVQSVRECSARLLGRSVVYTPQASTDGDASSGKKAPNPLGYSFPGVRITTCKEQSGPQNLCIVCEAENELGNLAEHVSLFVNSLGEQVKDQQVLFLGFGLGGALALRLACELASQYKQGVCIAFDAPHVDGVELPEDVKLRYFNYFIEPNAINRATDISRGRVYLGAVESPDPAVRDSYDVADFFTHRSMTLQFIRNLSEALEGALEGYMRGSAGNTATRTGVENAYAKCGKFISVIQEGAGEFYDDWPSRFASYIGELSNLLKDTPFYDIGYLYAVLPQSHSLEAIRLRLEKLSEENDSTFPSPKNIRTTQDVRQRSYLLRFDKDDLKAWPAVFDNVEKILKDFKEGDFDKMGKRINELAKCFENDCSRDPSYVNKITVGQAQRSKEAAQVQGNEQQLVSQISRNDGVRANDQELQGGTTDLKMIYIDCFARRIDAMIIFSEGYVAGHVSRNPRNSEVLLGAAVSLICSCVPLVGRVAENVLISGMKLCGDREASKKAKAFLNVFAIPDFKENSSTEIAKLVYAQVHGATGATQDHDRQLVVFNSNPSRIAEQDADAFISGVVENNHFKQNGSTGRAEGVCDRSSENSQQLVPYASHKQLEGLCERLGEPDPIKRPSVNVGIEAVKNRRSSGIFRSVIGGIKAVGTGIVSSVRGVRAWVSGNGNAQLGRGKTNSADSCDFSGVVEIASEGKASNNGTSRVFSDSGREFSPKQA